MIALVAAGADIEARSSKGWTAIHVAAGYGRASIISYLVRRGANVNTVDNDGDTPLVTAAALGHQGAVHILLTSGANPNYMTNVSCKWSLILLFFMA